METKAEAATYTHGHHASVLQAHIGGTAENSAAYLLPHLTPNKEILDIGCGAGTITLSFASYVSRGRVVGMDRASEMLEQARFAVKQRQLSNVEFVTGDANALDYPDGSFDIVHCHQVLQHVNDPVGVLKEMRRVAKPRGLVAAREGDYGGFLWYPDAKGVKEWQDLYRRVARYNGGEPDAGRRVHVWAREAGFTPCNIECFSSAWCYNTPAEILDFSQTWAERTVSIFLRKDRNRGRARYGSGTG